MKKLLLTLSSISLLTVSSSTVIACIPNATDINFDFDKNIGTQFDTRNAKDTSDDKTKHKGFSNFFTLGDSLSDQGGLQTIVKDQFNINLRMSGEYIGGFSNGLTTAALINQELAFSTQEFKSSNLVHKPEIELNQQKVWGKNYSVGGATAYETKGATSLLLGNTGIYKQAQALVEQQVIHDDDLFLVEIGGNDMFAILDNLNNSNKREEIMQNALLNIKNALYTLLNNGAKKLVFLSPPDMTLIPRYYKINQATKEIIKMIGDDFNYEISKIIKIANKMYNDSILFFDLYTRFSEITQEFKNSGANKNITEELCDSTTSDLSGIDITNFELKATVKEKNVGKEEDFFFLDYVHPTKNGHQFAKKIIFNEIEKKWNQK
ncbi:SGNH/GDSL hydrolase family protein [Spiroplasma cantharicola]|uniref:Lipolytic enzyme, GDSL family n=1 Tax=Spiroplasma cantharicola TaxID=362837 RepID=A0A0M4KCK2_9MOLU|nr:SGNH/GDSL hydrolase family protein [Spiroplasma cantharicola]ALD66465.1 lipolytic enzyme, GDSL family [Spiroplasma cantharicola]